MTIRIKILLVAMLLLFGLSISWISGRQVKVGFSNLEACRNQCKLENKTGKLMPFSSTQIKKNGDFKGPLKCYCIPLADKV
jgi:hypothetical protein